MIARNWRALEPVRSACEARGVPVQLATEDAPAFWRLRETQDAVRWLEAHGQALVEFARLREWLVARGDGPWWALLREGIQEFAEEAGGALVLVATLLDWLADWGRQARRRQTGLLLLTAHRAKGLEFNDVVVLDGGWDRTSRREDRDLPRRLYDVAMTRARRSSALARFDRGNAIIDDRLDDDAFLRREKIGEQRLATAPEVFPVGPKPHRSELRGTPAWAKPGDRRDQSARTRRAAGLGYERRSRRLAEFARHCRRPPRARFAAPEGYRFVRGQVIAVVERRDKNSKSPFGGPCSARGGK